MFYKYQTLLGLSTFILKYLFLPLENAQQVSCICLCFLYQTLFDIFSSMSKLGKFKEHPAVQEYLRELCRKAGSVTSDRKAKAVRKNGLSPCGPGKRRGRPKKEDL